LYFVGIWGCSVAWYHSWFGRVFLFQKRKPRKRENNSFITENRATGVQTVFSLCKRENVSCQKRKQLTALRAKRQENPRSPIQPFSLVREKRWRKREQLQKSLQKKEH